MSRIKIVTDSTCDIPLGVAHDLGIEIVPMTLYDDEHTFRAGIDLTNEQFYTLLTEEHAELQAQSPTALQFRQVYRRLAGEYDYIYSIHLSSRLGGVYQEAVQARAQMPASATRIEIIDSKLASMALGLVIEHAARAVRDGATPAQLTSLIGRLMQHCHIVFFVDTVEYLERSGRLGLATAVLGSMARIKPLMLLDDGEIVPYERTRTRAKAIEGLFTFIEDFPSVQEVVALFSTTPEDVDKLLDKVEPIFPREQVRIAQFGPSIGAYLGPGAMGVAVFEGLGG
ncbi:MAG: DegV family protein [Chloroflexi bacterium]|nr:DegV family protein [Chloroflexota bacterium]